MININKKLLTAMGACPDEKKWFLKEFKSVTLATEKDAVEFIGKLPKNKLNNCIWFLTESFSKKQNVRLAVYAAKRVLPIYEDYSPNGTRLRKNLEVVERWLDGDATTDDVINAAADAVAVAYPDFARAATYVAYAVAYAVYAAAASDVAVANATVWAVVWAARSAHGEDEFKIEILTYGIKLFFEKRGNR